jgi:hypothetical protein
MTSDELTQRILSILVRQFAKALEERQSLPVKRIEKDLFQWRIECLYGQASRERTCYEKDGKHYLRSYNSHVEKDGEYYDGYNLWELDGENLKYLGGLHR